ncbi:23S rRNA pseudouridine(2605) synthase RluB [Cronobacter turicensis]|uniref:Pseudouridine synthase n=1 Tax=Cronobacter turicensis (strain DSM 18703 / CCUG 55852 / LMG 23827 / z3032) TaxID=693216 RepID=C9XTN8_CROTZ|nr:23S rRNA pseudouridine(2605) synthase RluB [Cronobacter turicensis]CBA31307.1 Ribosomal large subunit pseudouridine synthase B [Cronobacter turicensis z3032]EGT5740412.1 23S rRNA pseudouridine(2605) synthase RluB [Cronobacter turicensis]EKM0374444.1 23S rRNA pseudouridine(2605) synthase RluB [Cronobacter turicensis]EKM5063970.1 23S rRNA pseudouridine(2605) synthase RluB [Cronobacter turicensis]
MSEKLQKVLARAGHGSRREIEAMIEAGRVSVDGKIATLGDRVEVTPALKIRIDGHLISVKESVEQICRVLAYYKPEGELCTRSDPEGRPTVFDRLPKLRGARWIAVGRLDVNTCGLLLFTTDGELANRLMHPSQEVEREYAVRVFGQVDDNKVRELARGVQLEDGPAAFKTIRFSGGEGINQWYNVTLTEGRNREVRRLWEAVGVQVSRLIRVRYGDIPLPKGLPRGGWTELDLAQTNYLRELVGLPPETASKVAVEKDRRRMKANQIRRAVKRHSQTAGGPRQGSPARQGQGQAGAARPAGSARPAENTRAGNNTSRASGNARPGGNPRASGARATGSGRPNSGSGRPNSGGNRRSGGGGRGN